MIKEISKTKVAICCGGACPTVERSEEGLFIFKDDFGGEIKLSQKEAEHVALAVAKLTE